MSMCPRPTLVHRSPYSRSPTIVSPHNANVRTCGAREWRQGAPERAFILLRFAFCRLLKVVSVRGSVTPARSPRQRPGQNRDAPTDHVFAGGLRSLLDSARESYPDTARGSRTRLFQSVYPRSALVAQCRLRWFVNPACRGAEQIVSWGPSHVISPARILLSG